MQVNLMNMQKLLNYKNRYCGQCRLQDCNNCRVKNFISFVGLQETPHVEFKSLMRSNMPVDIEHRNGRFTQKHGNIIK